MQLENNLANMVNQSYNNLYDRMGTLDSSYMNMMKSLPIAQADFTPTTTRANNVTASVTQSQPTQAEAWKNAQIARAMQQDEENILSRMYRDSGMSYNKFANYLNNLER